MTNTLAYNGTELIKAVKSFMLHSGRHDIEHNDIQQNDIQQNDTQHNDAQHNEVQHNGFNCETQHK